MNNKKPLLASLQSEIGKRGLLKNVATVATGTAAAQGVAIAFTPLITRLFGPENFGLQGVFLSVAGLFTIVSGLGYPSAMILPRSDTDALALGRISVKIGLVMTFGAVILLSLLGHEVLTLLKAEEVSAFLYLIPVAMQFTLVSTVLNQWLIRKRAYEITAVCGVASAAIINTVKAVGGALHPSALLLILTGTSGGLFASLLSVLGWRATKKSSDVELVADVGSVSEWRLVKEYRDFAVLRTPQELINAISQSLPVLLLASFFGVAAAGQYTIAVTALGVPSNLIASSIYAVFYPRITEAIQQREDARRLILKATVGMALVGFVPFVAVMMAGPVMFRVVFGSEWQGAGVYAQFLSVMLFLQYVNKPAVAAIPALRAQGGSLIYELVSTVLKIASLWIGFRVLDSDVLAVALYSLSGALSYTALIAWVIWRSGSFAPKQIHV